MAMPSKNIRYDRLNNRDFRRSNAATYSDNTVPDFASDVSGPLPGGLPYGHQLGVLFVGVADLFL